MRSKRHISIHGHRGARGLFPENTITAFLEALKLGVDAIEMDVVVSKDNKIVVSHEAWMNPLFCSFPSGEKIHDNEKTKYNLYKMSYAEIAAFDCGAHGNPYFRTQKAVPERKPLLSEVIIVTEKYLKENNLPQVLYNVEIKTEDGHGAFNPAPKRFAELVHEELKNLNVSNKCLVQSFDNSVLQQMRLIDDKITIGLLVENQDNAGANLSRLDFVPDYYNPEFNLVNEQMLEELRSKNIKVVPWTVNQVTDMKRLIEMGVDGLITDYPDKALRLTRSK